MTERIQKALALLQDEFDAVAIIATSHDFENNETARYTFSVGNKYAVECIMREAVEDLDMGMHEFIMGGSNGEEEEAGGN